MTTEAASVVADDDPIRVKHWNNLKYETLSKDPSRFLLAHQVVEEALHHKAAI
jgi:hypothetical protein